MKDRQTVLNASRLLTLTLGIAILIGIIVLIHGLIAGRIAEQKARARLAPLREIVPRSLYDNDLLEAGRVLSAPAELGLQSGAQAYIASRKGHPTAIILPVTTQAGYGGPISLLVALTPEGEILRVHVTREKETPGLGGQIRENKAGWLDQFQGRSLTRPETGRWKVTADQGAFDAITGATVTSRAVIGAVHTTLTYFQKHDSQLLSKEETGTQP